MTKTHKHAVKHDDFLSFLEAMNADAANRVKSHPHFNREKHNSLKGAMSLDPAAGPTISEDECHDIVGSILGAADKHGNEYGSKMMFGDKDLPDNLDLDDDLGGDFADDDKDGTRKVA